MGGSNNDNLKAVKYHHFSPHELSIMATVDAPPSPLPQQASKVSISGGNSGSNGNGGGNSSGSSNGNANGNGDGKVTSNQSAQYIVCCKCGKRRAVPS